ncbi:putative ABC transporter ATP-binding protein YfiB [Halobacillus andaensis]|uniref:ABC transporter ATP-binding protein YfiB n=1 Tax=Halobacillus andaensis TaxID=1176239 RepID=A0A917EW00_HALAA|nr:ABC transporter ATP-binding protein [Halobacillus andaensis]MBP2004652.1 ATP-binding cassette subfamily B protein [Halobacillus andaensis]GGF19979.1 putative ABC transporter ATP-binding protein YfiB [Halobacillus andaensis]
MRKVFSYASAYKASAIIAILLMLIELAVELVQPLLMAHIIDEGIMKENYTVVSIWGGVLVGLSLLAFAAGITNSFFAANVSQGVGFDLRRDLFKKVQSFTNENFQSYSTPNLVTRMTNDVIQIQNLVLMLMRIALRAPLFIIFALVMAFTVNVTLAFILVVAVPLLGGFLFWVLIKGVKLFKSVQTRLDGVNTVIRENLAGVRLVKGFNRGEYEEERFHGVNQELMVKNKRALWLMEIAMPVVMLGMNVIILVLLFAGAIQLNIGGAQAGEVVAIINYATRIMFTFSIFSFLIMVFSRGNASANRVTEVLDEKLPEFVTNTEGEQATLLGNITFNNVSFSRDRVEILRDISFQVKAGQMVGILGETGSGKTSLLHLLPRLHEKEKGNILFDRMEINEMDVKSLREQISLVPQEVHLFSGTVRDNIAWGKEKAEEQEIIEAAKQAEIHSFITTLPNGYDTVLGQKGVTFSGGQKQRLSIARALVRKPKVLILDDSTSALDAHTETRLLQTLKEQECTIFMVAQKISSLKAADHILVLHRGEVIAQGDHQQLLRISPYYQEVYQSQQEDVM